ncbi:LuxR C-terminal-related transcriptional regulator [Agromyces sp. SYSU T0242]|uniref:LuxR C-terminal-related transcriptional regulator n=1 Tax=Agromyces litoreus TaxID=3158561 RepID=UPI00339745A6
MPRASVRGARGQGDLPGAATDAFWIFSAHLYSGEPALAMAWIGRARRLADELAEPEPGWARVAEAYGYLGRARFEEARGVLGPAVTEGRTGGDLDLESMAELLTARSLLLDGRREPGVAILDDVMIRVLAGRLSPRLTSTIYCAAIGTCEAEARDVVRAQDWSRHMEQWMAALPAPPSGALLGNCRVYRAILRRRSGDLSGALEDLEAAAATLHQEHSVHVEGHAWYELGETHRDRGDHVEADAAYRTAAALGHPVHPGLALLRLEQGAHQAALQGLRRALAEATRPMERARLLPALVSVALAEGRPDDASGAAAADAARPDLDEARRAIDELESVAAEVGSSIMDAELSRARGQLALADGRPDRALPELRRAAGTTRGLEHPLETARTQVLIAAACRDLGDREAELMELGSAEDTCERIGAVRERDRVRALRLAAESRTEERGAYGLSPREREVLALLAEGRTNRAIAEEIYVSERTVHRHVSNIFDKLGVHSRTEAAIFAVAHDLDRSG